MRLRRQRGARCGKGRVELALRFFPPPPPAPVAFIKKRRTPLTAVIFLPPVKAQHQPQTERYRQGRCDATRAGTHGAGPPAAPLGEGDIPSRRNEPVIPEAEGPAEAIRGRVA